jgi:putative flippase GtrA
MTHALTADEVRPAHHRARMISRTLRRFLTVGVVNTAIDIALFTVLQAPLGVVAANFLSTSAGMVFSFLVNGRFTFATRRPTWRHAGLFVLTTGSTMWLLQPILIDTAHAVFGLRMMVAKVGSLGASVVANFVLYRYVVWPDRAADFAGGGVSAELSSKHTAEPATPRPRGETAAEGGVSPSPPPEDRDAARGAARR